MFTPSILTILGVIIYLRFGWVAANDHLPHRPLHGRHRHGSARAGRGRLIEHLLTGVLMLAAEENPFDEILVQRGLTMHQGP